MCLLCRRRCGCGARHGPATFCSLDHLQLDRKKIHKRTAFYIIDRHFVKNINYIFVSRFRTGFDHHYKIFRIG